MVFFYLFIGEVGTTFFNNGVLTGLVAIEW